MVKSTNYVALQGWMVTDLKLKGNDLIVYAVIYGFCQTPGEGYDHCFRGSLDYLAEWCNCSRQGVIKNIDNLVRMGLIRKESGNPTNKYFITREQPHKQILMEDSKQSSISSKQSLQEEVNNVYSDSKLSLQNNINNIDNNIDKKNAVFKEAEEIIGYFNSICSTNFKPYNKATQKAIKSLLEQHYSLQDMKDVIQYKYKEWGVNPKPFSNGQMSNEFLRPCTLFGPKFESYLYEARLPKNNSSVSVSVSEDDDDHTGIFF